MEVGVGSAGRSARGVVATTVPYAVPSARLIARSERCTVSYTNITRRGPSTASENEPEPTSGMSRSIARIRVRGSYAWMGWPAVQHWPA